MSEYYNIKAWNVKGASEFLIVAPPRPPPVLSLTLKESGYLELLFF